MAIKERELEGRFVELAVQILKEEPNTSAPPLREWATQVLDRYSGVPLGLEVKQALIKTILLPSPQNLVKSLLEEIDALAAPKAINLANRPPINDEEIDKIVKQIDPKGLAKNDPQIARKILKMRIAMGKRNDETLEKWEAAINTK
jgi:hypothetical protein